MIARMARVTLKIPERSSGERAFERCLVCVAISVIGGLIALWIMVPLSVALPSAQDKN
jgi:hypothetical protein